MPVWKFHVPTDQRFAHLNNLWVSRPHTNCTACGGHLYDPIHHLEVEWNDGSDAIPDFVFAVGPTILRRNIADELLSNFKGFTQGEVRMPDHPNLRRPNRVTKRTPKRVRLPYDGPELCYMRCEEVDILPQSTALVDKDCLACGVKTYKNVTGIERKNSREHVARVPDAGLFFAAKAVGDLDIFQPRHMGFQLCTDRVREFVQTQNWINVEFLDVGDIVP